MKIIKTLIKIIVWMLFLPSLVVAIANLFSGNLELFIGSAITLFISLAILGAVYEW